MDALPIALALTAALGTLLVVVGLWWDFADRPESRSLADLIEPTAADLTLTGRERRP